MAATALSVLLVVSAELNSRADKEEGSAIWFSWQSGARPIT
ncbi:MULTISPECIES: hypothetical protein [Bradyrhizobium]|nr:MULTISPECIES: hypothetical protein [Bradyrhizobium]